MIMAKYLYTLNAQKANEYDKREKNQPKAITNAAIGRKHFKFAFRLWDFFSDFSQ